MDPPNRPANQLDATTQPSSSDIARGSPQRDAHPTSALAESVASQQSLDSRMDVDDEMPALRNVSDGYEDMPGLQDASDSSDDDDDEEDGNDLHDVEMQPPSTGVFVSPPTLVPSSTGAESSTRATGSRRARVEDDDDSERDRRHPSQRASSRVAHNNDLPVPQMPAFRIHMMASNGDGMPPISLQYPMNAGPDANSGNNNNATASVPPAHATPLPNPTAAADGTRPRLPHNFLNIRENRPGGGILIGGLMSIPLGGNQDGRQQPATGAANGTNNNPATQDNAAPTGDNAIDDFLAAVGLSLTQALGGPPGVGAIPININLGNIAFGLEEKEDPERAKKLVEGLEDVPVGLVKRLVRVGGTGGGMGEDENKGGDAGCAICWDSLLDAEGSGFGKSEPASASAPDEANAESSSSKPEATQPRIVSLPCAHVFHADCLIPWFSRPRQTTCPTCRFNIDPDNLTYVSAARRERERRAAQATARAANPDAPVADAPAPEDNANINPAEPDENLLGTGLPHNFPLPPGARISQSITMEMVFGLPLWPPTDQPNAPPPPPGLADFISQAIQAENRQAVPAGDAADAQAALGTAQDALLREHERHLRHLMARHAAATGRPPPLGANPQTNANGGPNDVVEGGDNHQEAPAERPHRASSAPPPSTAPLPRVSQLPQPGAAGPASPQPTQPGATSPRGTQLPPFLPNLFNNPTGAPRNPAILAGSGRTLNEALTQMFGSLISQLGGNPNAPPAAGQQPAPQQGGAAAPIPVPAAGEPAAAPAPPPNVPSPAAQPVTGAPAPAPPTQANNASNNANASPLPNAAPLPNAPPFRLFPFPFPMDSMGPRPDPNRPKPAWTLPPAPGPTLRQRIERREREAGLRCYDMSCGIGPSDEEPELSKAVASIKQLAIRGTDGAEVCVHRFHGACLVSAERVAMAARSAELVCEDGNVEVSCPVCRGAGSVTTEEWADGVATLG